MKLPFIIVATVATNLLVGGIFADEEQRSNRVARQTSADQMVQNILKWLQGVYTQQSRRSRFADYNNLFNFASGKLDDAFRQGTLREYLPPTNTQKPRPFETAKPPGADGTDQDGNYIYGGYPPAGSITPQPPFPIYPNTATNNGYPTTGYPRPNYPDTPTGYPTRPTDSTGQGGYPTPSFPTHPSETPAPGGFTGYPRGPASPDVTTEGPAQPTISTSAPTDRPGFPTQPPSGISTGYPTPEVSTGYPERPGFPTQPPTEASTGYPERPGFPTQPPSEASTGYPERPGFPTQPPSEASTGYPERPGLPTQPPAEASTGYPERPGFPTQPPAEASTGYPERPRFPTQPPPGISTGYPEASSTQPPSELTSLPTPGQSTGYPTQQPDVTDTPVTSGQPTEAPTSGPSTNPSPTETFTSATTSEEQTPAATATTQSPEINTIPTENPQKPGDTEPVETDNEDLKHPPHIHAIEVECAKDMMTINIEFNRDFNGVIYSKGYYNMPECRYVKENSNQAKYTFTVNLNMCGTEFINAFDTQGQSYLENVLVLQNEAGIQEVWDTVRAVRCLWEGNLKESLSVALSVGMLSQELVTFSGDTAVAKLDILMGKGALGQPANGLVKIGEPMTLVVSVSGDPGFDIQVKDCRAIDSSGDNTIPLSDDNGCILNPKLFGAFQKTRNTGDSGASIIAYAYFNAFKFPDVMDLMIECNIELCKTDCDMCTDPNQKLEPGRRRRRDLYSYNETLHDGVTMGKHLRIILPEDLNEKSIIDLGKNDGVCMSTQSFVFSTALMISLLTVSCLFSAYMWLKTQQLKLIKQ